MQKNKTDKVIKDDHDSGYRISTHRSHPPRSGLALGLTINDGCYAFAPKLPEANLKLFFAVPNATGHYIRQANGSEETIGLRILTGSFTCRQLTFALASGPCGRVSVNVEGTIARQADRVAIAFPQPLTLRAGETIEVRTNKD